MRNPQLLYNHESEEPNFSWMRTVSKEEAMNTLANMEKWLKKPVSESKGEGMGEWVFRGESTISERLAPDSTPIEELQEKYAFSQREEDTVVEPTRKIKTKQLEKKIEKKEILSCIVGLCKKNGWSYVKNYMDETMKCDILINYNDKSFAIKASRKSIEFLRESNKKEMVESNLCYPIFDIEWKDEDIIVSKFGSPSISVREFVKAYIEGRIQNKQSLTVKRIGVYFSEIECYSCKKKHYVYFIKKIMDEKGIIRTIPDDIDYRFNVFDPAILNRVKVYIATHKEEGLVMGDIKERYNNTMQKPYLSFGCPNCDGLLGDHYYNELVMDYMYDNSDDKVCWMDLDTDIFIEDYPHWEYVY